MDVQMLQLSLAELSASFNTRMAHFEAELPKTPTNPVTTSTLAADFASFKCFVKETLNTLQRQIEFLARQVDTLEMRGRRKMLLVHGVQEKTKEETAEVVVALVKDTLKIPDFTVSSIRRCHRMGRTAGDDKARAIAVKFDNAVIRDRIWFAKTKLKGTGITVSEFLTKQRHAAFVAARERFGVTRCWTREGIIQICGSDGSRHRVVSICELNKVAKSEAEKDAAKQNPTAKVAPKSKRVVAKK